MRFSADRCCCDVTPQTLCLAGSTVPGESPQIALTAISGSIQNSVGFVNLAAGDVFAGTHEIVVNHTELGNDVVPVQTRYKRYEATFELNSNDAHCAFYPYYKDSDNWHAIHAMAYTQGNESHPTQVSPPTTFKYPLVAVFQVISFNGVTAILQPHIHILDRWTPGYRVCFKTDHVPDFAGAGIEVLTPDLIYSSRTYGTTNAIVDFNLQNYFIGSFGTSPNWLAPDPWHENVRFEGISGQSKVMARVRNTTLWYKNTSAEPPSGDPPGHYVRESLRVQYGCPEESTKVGTYSCGPDSFAGLSGTFPSAINFEMPLLGDNGGGACCSNGAGIVYRVPRVDNQDFCDYQLDLLQSDYACAGENGNDDSWRIFLSLYAGSGIEPEINGYLQRFNEGGGVGFSGRIEIYDDLDVGPKGSNTFDRLIPEWVFNNVDTLELGGQSSRSNVWVALDHNDCEVYMSQSLPCTVIDGFDINLGPGDILP